MEEQVTLTQMLRAREERAARQQALLEQYGLPLVSFVMNIAGPVKDSPLIRQGFALGEKLLFQQLLRENVPCVYQEKVNAPTGPDGLYVVKAPAAQVKSLAEELEEGFPLGRLWDMDVLSPQGIKLERAAPRRCLLCGQPPQVCARSPLTRWKSCKIGHGSCWRRVFIAGNRKPLPLSPAGRCSTR